MLIASDCGGKRKRKGCERDELMYEKQKAAECRLTS